MKRGWEVVLFLLLAFGLGIVAAVLASNLWSGWLTIGGGP